MRRSDLVRAAARKSKVKIEVAQDVIDAFFDAVTLSLMVDEEVKLRGFGKFETRERKATKIYSPRGDGEIDVPARRTVAFLPATPLKERLNGHRPT